MPTSAHLDTVQLVQLDELPALRVRNAHADALIALQGAQLLEYAPRDRRPIIWLSERAEFKRDQGVRGGIPVCWPWFGELARNPAAVRAAVPHPGAPAHGLVRSQAWLLESIAERAEDTEIVLRFPTSALSAAWPHSAELTLGIVVGATLRLRLCTRNTGNAPLAFSQALHTYFSVSDSRRIEIHGFEGTRYIDTLDGWREFSQHGPIRADGEIDRIYQEVPDHVELRDPDWGRTIHLRSARSRSAVVWNPHTEKAKRLSQFDSDAWQRMFCIETANVMADSVELAAGEERSLDLEIWSQEN